MLTRSLRGHPAYQGLVQRYRLARQAWHYSLGVRESAALFGMSERAYCDSYIACNCEPIMWSSTSTNYQEITRKHYDAAYEEAVGGQD